MSAILLALAASLAFGTSDFLASRVTRRLVPALLLLYSQMLQAACLLLVLWFTGQSFAGAALAWGMAGGVFDAVALSLYYRALAIGPASIVAPLAASGAVLPVMVDLVRGEAPGPLALIGLAIVLSGIILVTLAPTGADDQVDANAHRLSTPTARPSFAMVLAVTAAAAFGIIFLLLDQGVAAAGGSVLWVPLGLQAGVLPAALIGAWTTHARRPPVAEIRTLLLPIAALTLLNLGADVALIYALISVQLGVVSVLASLGPGVTALLALTIAMERPTGRQVAGAFLALLGTLVVVASR